MKSASLKPGRSESRRKYEAPAGFFELGRSIRFAVPRPLLACALASQGCFSALFLAGLQIERMTFDVLDDIFRHYFSLKALQRALQAFTFVKLNFCQNEFTSISDQIRLFRITSGAKPLVGPPGFEPGTSCTPSRRASQAAPRPERFILPHSTFVAINLRA